jgi:hypothetical protein
MIELLEGAGLVLAYGIMAHGLTAGLMTFDRWLRRHSESRLDPSAIMYFT